jgi:lipopolysaccharide export system protein LptA
MDRFIGKIRGHNKASRNGLGACLLLASLMTPSLVNAQLVAKGTSPIMYSADNMVADNSQHLVTFEGRVELLQEDARLRADFVKIIYAKTPGTDKWDKVSRIEATGNIYYVIDDQVMKGDQAIYTEDNETMVMTGDVVLTQGKNVMAGNRLVYNVKEGKSVMDGSPTGNGKGRVKGVFYPDQSQVNKANP